MTDDHKIDIRARISVGLSERCKAAVAQGQAASLSRLVEDALERLLAGESSSPGTDDAGVLLALVRQQGQMLSLLFRHLGVSEAAVDATVNGTQADPGDVRPLPAAADAPAGPMPADILGYYGLPASSVVPEPLDVVATPQPMARWGLFGRRKS
jgi:hypothetical protein